MLARCVKRERCRKLEWKSNFDKESSQLNVKHNKDKRMWWLYILINTEICHSIEAFIKKLFSVMDTSKDKRMADDDNNNNNKISKVEQSRKADTFAFLLAVPKATLRGLLRYLIELDCRYWWERHQYQLHCCDHCGSLWTRRNENCLWSGPLQTPHFARSKVSIAQKESKTPNTKKLCGKFT